MSKNETYCAGCERDVGAVIKRGQYKAFIVLSVFTFIGLIVAQVMMGPSQADLYMNQKYGSQIASAGVNDLWLILPVFLFVAGIVSFLKSKKLCPICNKEL